MTPGRESRLRSRRRRRGCGAIVAAVALVVVFAVGIAVGESLHDNPRPGETRTLVRTLLPLQVPPAARTTVTVTRP